jgi:ComF family protein
MWQQIQHHAERIGKAFLYLAYPALCLHCRDGMENPDHLLCPSCLTLLSLIDFQERCPTCFGADYEPIIGKCADCDREKFLLHRRAAAFEYLGPAETLVKKFKYSNKPYLAKLLASYLVAQFFLLEWPKPDLVIPVPMPWTHLMSRGYNQSALLAHEVAQMLDVPFGDVLRRRAGDYSQAGLSIEQRRQLTQSTLSLKQGISLHDKTLLLIDDVMTTGTTLNRCAETLMTGFPDRVYALAFCAA